ncbi:MAG: radical SAM protein [Candidatus Omnitrophica bacterium]|nr:radical SAM protein [Candidatus Omnitrophota bacterium]
MCYAIPGKVKEVKPKQVIVDYFGEEKKAVNELDDICPGDYIYAQGGYVIEKIPSDEAESILSVWKETFFELQEADLRLSRISLENDGADKKLFSILDKVLEGISPTKSDLLYIMELTDRASLDLVYKAANFLRHKHLKNSCCVHGIIEFSNYCQQDCGYCGISNLNTNLSRYRMNLEQVVDIAKDAVNRYGFRALVLQSGEDSFYSVDKLVDIVKEIKKQVGVLICISVGEIGLEGLEKLYQAGARALLMRFETSNQKIYQQLHPGKSLDERFSHIKKARELGYLIMTGGLIGLPGQTNQDFINDIYMAKELGAEMFSFGPFLPHPDTPLAENKPPTEDEVLKVLAISRFVDPENAKILITTAFETLDSDARKKGLLAGANSVMLNVTPPEFREKYSIYPDRAYIKDEVSSQIEQTIGLLRSLGRAPTDLGIQ